MTPGQPAAWCHHPDCWGTRPATKVCRRYYTGRAAHDRYGTLDRFSCDAHAVNPMLVWEQLPKNPRPKA